jgi:hypothetical protein
VCENLLASIWYIIHTSSVDVVGVDVDGVDVDSVDVDGVDDANLRSVKKDDVQKLLNKFFNLG